MASFSVKRKHIRVQDNMPLKFSLSVLDFKTLQKVHSSGTGIDISKEGMGFYTDFPLEPGHILRIERESEPVETAMVRWVDRFDSKFRVGVFLYK
jgi:hypothetical protein